MYKPVFDEFMSRVQAYPSKLWFTGQHENWKLANFEIHEIMESIDDIQQNQSERKESAKITMINPALGSVTGCDRKKRPFPF